MKIITRLSLAAVLLFVAVYSEGQEVHYNYDRGANFASYKTYRWVNLDGAAPDELIDQAIKRAIDEQLGQKGLTKVETEADLYIGYQAAVNLEKRVDLWSTGMGPGGWGWGDRTIQGQTSTIPVGMLVVDLYDRAKKQLVWRGDASKSLDLKKDPDKNYKNLQKVMAKLFKNYPPHGNK